MRIPTKSIGDATLRNTLGVSKKPQKLFAVLGYNSGPDQFIQVHERSLLVGDDLVPKHSFPVASGQYFSFDLGLVGEDLDAIIICNSTTAETLTLGAEDVSIQAILHA
jgi:hypothetical protein